MCIFFVLYIHCAVRISVRFTKQSVGIDVDKSIVLMTMVINRNLVYLA